MEPVVSICIPTYNDPKKLRRCLDSLFSQVYTNYEVIISDDSPGDEVKDVVSAFQNRSITYVKNGTPLGSPGNWNKAIGLATGEFIKIMHHDDWFGDNQSLGEFVLMMTQNKEAIFGFGPSIDVLENGEEYRRNFPTPSRVVEIQKNPRCLFWGNRIGAPSATIFRNNMGLKFDIRYKWLVDTEFYIRVISKSRVSLVYNEKAMVNIGIADSQISQACFCNPAVEVAENILLYSEMRPKKLSYLKDAIHLLRILYRCGIKRYSEIRKYGKLPNRFIPISIGIWTMELPYFSDLLSNKKSRLSKKN